MPHCGQWWKDGEVGIAIVHFVNYKKGSQTRGSMGGVMSYVMQEKKTMWEGQQLVSGINCQAQSVYNDFLNTKLLYHKDSGVMFYHMVQSFPSGEQIDPRQAHGAARRLAGYFSGCEVLVCTHIDRDHVHSHCIINSVNFETGKKLHMAKEQLQDLMRRNDEICREMGLPVFCPDEQNLVRGMDGAEYHVALKGQSWKLRLANTVDECMRYAGSRAEFISLMASEGYAVRWEDNRQNITYTTPDGRNCRDNKLHENKYRKEAMEHEFRIRSECISAEIAARVKTDESTEQQRACTEHIDDAHRDPVSATAGNHQADAAGRGDQMGTGEYSPNAPRPENTYRPDRDAENAGEDRQPAGTGWEEERETYLQMAEVAAGLRLPNAGQVAGTAADSGSGGTGGVVWRSDDHQQYPQPVPLTPGLRAGLSGLAAAGALLDNDSEDAEEKRRRMEAKMEGENIGVLLGLAAGAVIALTQKEEQQNDEQQTML